MYIIPHIGLQLSVYEEQERGKEKKAAMKVNDLNLQYGLCSGTVFHLWLEQRLGT